jgi:hypothetical protein
MNDRCPISSFDRRRHPLRVPTRSHWNTEADRSWAHRTAYRGGCVGRTGRASAPDPSAVSCYGSPRIRLCCARARTLRAAKWGKRSIWGEVSQRRASSRATRKTALQLRECHRRVRSWRGGGAEDRVWPCANPAPIRLCLGSRTSPIHPDKCRSGGGRLRIIQGANRAGQGQKVATWHTRSDGCRAHRCGSSNGRPCQRGKNRPRHLRRGHCRLLSALQAEHFRQSAYRSGRQGAGRTFLRKIGSARPAPREHGGTLPWRHTGCQTAAPAKAACRNGSRLVAATAEPVSPAD